ncbi:MAG: HU family DNA-binding protein [Arenibacterium sp.]
MATTTEQASATSRWADILHRTRQRLAGRRTHDTAQESERNMKITPVDTEAVTEFVNAETPEGEVVETQAITEETSAEDAELMALLDLKKKELVERVVDRLGFKKKDVKPVVEAVLQELGDAVAEGRALNLEPFGKLNINRTDTRPNGRITVCRLRQNLQPPVSVSEPLAEAAE